MRTLAGPASTASQSGRLSCVLFVEMQMSATLYFNTTSANIDWNGHTWVGCGPLGSIEEIEDAPGPYKSLRFTLSGVPTSLTAIALAEQIKGKPCKVYLGLCDADTWQVLDVVNQWAGRMDQMPIHEEGESLTIGVVAEHPGTLYSRPKPLRMTDADHQRLYPGDTSFRFLVDQANHLDAW